MPSPRDLVYLIVNHMPVVGEVVSFTQKRVRVAISRPGGYSIVLRAKHNLKMAKKARLMK